MEVRQLRKQAKEDCTRCEGSRCGSQYASQKAPANGDTFHTVHICRRLCKKNTAGDALRDPAHRARNTGDINSFYMETDQETMEECNAQMHTCQSTMYHGAHEAIAEHMQQACEPNQTAQAGIAKTENEFTHEHQEAASCAAKMIQADQSCDGGAEEESQSPGKAQASGHKRTRTCANPKAAMKSRLKIPHQKAVVGNKNTSSLCKKSPHGGSIS